MDIVGRLEKQLGRRLSKFKDSLTLDSIVKKEKNTESDPDILIIKMTIKDYPIPTSIEFEIRYTMTGQIVSDAFILRAEFNRYVYSPKYDQYVKRVPVEPTQSMVFGTLINALIEIALSQDTFQHFDKEGCTNTEKVKDVPKERLFRLKRGDCWDINELIDLVLDEEGNLKQNYQQELGQRIWRDPAQLTEIIRFSKRQASPSTDIKLYIPDHPITDGEHRKQFELLVALTLELDYIPKAKVDLASVQKLDDIEMKKIFLRHGHDLEEEINPSTGSQWLSAQNRGERYGKPKTRWDYLQHLLKNGFRAMGNYGKQFEFAPEKIEEQIQCFFYIIGKGSKKTIDDLVLALSDCYSGTYGKVTIIFNEKIFTGKSIFGRLANKIEEAKHNLVYIQFLEAIRKGYYNPAEPGYDEFHYLSGRIEAIKELSSGNKQIVNIQNKDPTAYLEPDPGVRLRIKNDFTGTWPIYLRGIVEEFVKEANGFKVPTGFYAEEGTEDYQNLVRESNRLLKGEDQFEIFAKKEVDVEGQKRSLQERLTEMRQKLTEMKGAQKTMLEANIRTLEGLLASLETDPVTEEITDQIGLDFKTGTLIILAMIIHHMMGFADIIIGDEGDEQLVQSPGQAPAQVQTRAQKQAQAQVQARAQKQKQAQARVDAQAQARAAQQRQREAKGRQDYQARQTEARRGVEESQATDLAALVSRQAEARRLASLAEKRSQVIKQLRDLGWSYLSNIDEAKKRKIKQIMDQSGLPIHAEEGFEGRTKLLTSVRAQLKREAVSQ